MGITIDFCCADSAVMPEKKKTVNFARMALKMRKRLADTIDELLALTENGTMEATPTTQSLGSQHC